MTKMGGTTLLSAGWRRIFQPLAFIALLFLVSAAYAEEEDAGSLALFNGSEPETVSIGRSPRPASQTAENITVVTSKDIEALNAHTLADVLFTVTGVELEQNRTPGTSVNLELQGSNFNHILVLIDNVPINNLSDNFPDIASVPVQMIERIEVVKGAASSSWGNALGGVINVITKAPQVDRPWAGMVSASGGKASTVDARGEITGTAKRLGYYLTGGKLRSDGLLPHNMVDLNHFYGKLHYELPGQGSLTATGFLTDLSEGQLQLPQANANNDISQILSTLSAEYPLSDRFTLQAMYRTRRFDSELFYYRRPTNVLARDLLNEETSNGGVVKLSYLDDLQRVVAGVDYDHVSAHLSEQLAVGTQLASTDRLEDDRVGVYLNDTFTLGKFAVTPSGRYDHTKTGGDLFSPSLGVTYALTDNTVIRGFTAKGYSLTSLNRSNSTEKVWTSQAGVESSDIPFLWLKGTFFRNETSDILLMSRTATGEVVYYKQRQLKQGVEVEARTLPVFNTSLSLGYTYIHAEDRDTDKVLKGVPRHTVDIGIRYEDSRHLRALLTGHYIDWNFEAEEPAKYRDIIWDFYLSKKVPYSDTGYVEVFTSIRNLFNGSQYVSPYYRNAARWAEVGVRCAF